MSNEAVAAHSAPPMRGAMVAGDGTLPPLPKPV